MSAVEDFFSVLFNLGEKVCLSRDELGVSIYPAPLDWAPSTEYQFFCVNPLRSKRAVENCIAYRNILISFNTKPSAESLHGLPFSTCVSLDESRFDVIIALNDSVADIATYDTLVNKIHSKLLHIESVVDASTSMSLIPNIDTHILEMNWRVPLEELEKWLGSVGSQPKPLLEINTHISESDFANYFILFGSARNGESSAVFKSACDMIAMGLSADEVFDKMIKNSKVNKKELLDIIRLALKATHGGMS